MDREIQYNVQPVAGVLDRGRRLSHAGTAPECVPAGVSGVPDILRERQARGEIRPELNPEAVAASLVGMWGALGLQARMFEDMDAAAVNA
ncbi:hypothetical protein DPQ33_02145 [Oceanidesulfovibrio indonesiensis]|uniref:Uncharacterized protein n=1 Tax=Oceanidesulfovibrio indonesiensis TaxID=54767 RepID=A0A7M3MIP9_9BACT|nr:hypothetical protein [Oceanidesulfovibrio indonesiensis]TVM19181.1 hypothetical protein DPQ33_02145 [Oceanidesulfovibrio indonesiensis]